ncbi:hypothetical protein D3C72_2009480 [compost metagenome]
MRCTEYTSKSIGRERSGTRWNSVCALSSSMRSVRRSNRLTTGVLNSANCAASTSAPSAPGGLLSSTTISTSLPGMRASPGASCVSVKK